MGHTFQNNQKGKKKCDLNFYAFRLWLLLKPLSVCVSVCVCVFSHFISCMRLILNAVLNLVYSISKESEKTKGEK